MALTSKDSEFRGSIKFPWILSKKRDLIFYIGSSLLGWVYVIVIVYYLPHIRTVTDPLRYSVGSIAGYSISIELLVLTSWAILFDAPHLFATIGRTFFDAEERRERRSDLRKSWLFFVIGPVLILVPYAIGLFMDLSDFILGLGAVIFLVGFRLWAYYHIVRQHWGFFQLYKRKNGDPMDREIPVNRVDYWFFQLSLYLPLIMFLTSDYYPDIPSSLFPDLGVHSIVVAGISITEVVNSVATIAYLTAIFVFVAFQFYFWRKGIILNGSKLLYMAIIVPLHFVALSHPIIVLFFQPIIGIGHNLQYHQIVYDYSQKKYVKNNHGNKDYRFSRLVFSNLLSYIVFGLAFTLLLYQGPWINWMASTAGMRLDGLVLNSVGMMVGIREISTLRLGELILGSVLLGWAMQHYYLDSKIWRVSKDKKLRENLKVS